MIWGESIITFALLLTIKITNFKFWLFLKSFSRIIFLVFKLKFSWIYSITSSSHSTSFINISHLSFWTNVFSFPLEPSIFHMIFNKTKGGKTQTNKISCKNCLGLKFKMKYDCIKKLINFVTKFTSKNKIHFKKKILMHKMSL